MSSVVAARAEYRFKSATAEEVFDAWVTAEDVRAWGGLSFPGDIKTIEIDPREGGGFLFSDVRDGEEARHWGTYQVFDRPRVLQFTWFVSEEEEREATSIVRIEIKPEGVGCSVVLTHEMDAEFVEYLEPTKNAWFKMLSIIDQMLLGR